MQRSALDTKASKSCLVGYLEDVHPHSKAKIIYDGLLVPALHCELHQAEVSPPGHPCIASGGISDPGYWPSMVIECFSVLLGTLLSSQPLTAHVAMASR